MSNSAFFYVDGIPTKGCWVDIDSTTDDDDIREALAAGGFIGRDEIGDPAYDGDIMVADIDGELVGAFFSSRTGLLNLGELVEAIDYCDNNSVDEAAVAAYVEDRGHWNEDDFRDSFCGEYDSEVAYAEELFDECYAHEIPENMRYYIDYKKFARDLFMTDYYFHHGYVFRR